MRGRRGPWDIPTSACDSPLYRQCDLRTVTLSDCIAAKFTPLRMEIKGLATAVARGQLEGCLLRLGRAHMRWEMLENLSAAIAFAQFVGSIPSLGRVRASTDGNYWNSCGAEPHTAAPLRHRRCGPGRMATRYLTASAPNWRMLQPLRVYIALPATHTATGTRATSSPKFGACASCPHSPTPRIAMTRVFRERSEAGATKGSPLATTCSKRVHRRRQLKTKKYTYRGTTPTPVGLPRAGRRWRRR